MNKGRIWPSSILILGLGAMSALSTLPTGGSCPFQARPQLASCPSTGQQVYQETLSLLEDRGQLDHRKISQSVAQAVSAELEESGQSTAMVGFMQMLYLPGQPERFVASFSAQVPTDRLWQAATEGLAQAVSGQARLMGTEEMQAYQSLYSLPMNGIGAVLAPSVDGQGLVIQRPLPGHPAERAGLQPGDRIIEVDGESTLEMGLYTGMTRLRGEAGTSVEIAVERQGQVSRMSITREPIDPGPSVSSSWSDSRTGHIQLNWIDYTSADQVSVALSELEGASQIVLDLRNLGGHDVTAVQRIASSFVPADTLVARMESREGSRHELRTMTPRQYSGQLTVLVNELTSGSAELLASCLQENGAQLVGTTTAGQPASLTMVPLANGTALQIPAESWYNASGDKLDGAGVQP